jgi:anti-anti-sigma factor
VNLHVSTDHMQDGMCVVRLDGELDIAAAGEVSNALSRVWDDGAGTVVMDLRGLSFMDSTGLRIIVQSDATARQAGKRFQIIRPPAPVQRLFEITDLQSRLEFVDPPDA